MPVRADTIPTDVAREFRAFARYLADTDATPYAIHCYAHLRATATVVSATPPPIIERALLAFSSWGQLGLRAADAYARFFLPRSVLRRRLVLALAILENSPGSSRPLNSSIESGLPRAALRLLSSGLVIGLSIGVGLLLLAPVHVVSWTHEAFTVSQP